MSHTSIVSSNTKNLNNRFVAAAVSFTLAVIMLAGVGFAQGNNGAVHNATHDTRHSISFPCH